MIRTTYFGGLGTELEPQDADLVLGVVRRPKPFVHEAVGLNEPSLGPPDELLDTYKAVVEAAEQDGHDHPRAIAWRSVGVERRYLQHLGRRGPQQLLAELRDRVRAIEGDLVLVCWERDVRFCHRRPLATVLADGLDDVAVEHHPDQETVAAEAEAEARDDLDGDDGPTETALTDFGGESA